VRREHLGADSDNLSDHGFLEGVRPARPFFS
jgi:hypothetical protein